MSAHSFHGLMLALALVFVVVAGALFAFAPSANLIGRVILIDAIASGFLAAAGAMLAGWFVVRALR